MSEIFFNTQNEKFRISARPSNILYLSWVEISNPLCTIYMTKLFLTVVSQAVLGMWKQTGGFGWLRGKWFKSSKFTRTFE